jgi:hypothetical protein
MFIKGYWLQCNPLAKIATGSLVESLKTYKQETKTNDDAKGTA